MESEALRIAIAWLLTMWQFKSSWFMCEQSCSNIDRKTHWCEPFEKINVSMNLPFMVKWYFGE
jgi:hypothetical protein